MFEKSRKASTMLANRNLNRSTNNVINAIFIASLLLALFAVGGLTAQPLYAQANVTQSTGPLSDEEIAGLLFMREEEKLAHDVYVTLNEQWDMRIFANISRSEQQHTDAVRNLLDQYGIADPALNTPVGVFVDPALQTLYDDLIAQGSQSLTDAIMVGNIIEETDILDLEARIAATEHADIAQLYSRLLKGSSNHLRAYSSTWERLSGETYVPQYLDQDQYDQIVDGTSGNRPTRGGQGRGRR